MNDWRKIGRTQQLGRELTQWVESEYHSLTQDQTQAIIKVLQGEQDTDTLTEEELKWLENKVHTLVTRKLLWDHQQAGGAVQHSSSVH
jgi:hypothetical protein